MGVYGFVTGAACASRGLDLHGIVSFLKKPESGQGSAWSTIKRGCAELLGRSRRPETPMALTLSRPKVDEGYFTFDRPSSEHDDPSSASGSRLLARGAESTADLRRCKPLPQEIVLTIFANFESLSALWNFRAVSRSFRDAAEYLVLQRLSAFSVHVAAPSSLRRRHRTAQANEETNGNTGESDEPPRLHGHADFQLEEYSDRLGLFVFKPDPACFNDFKGCGSAQFRAYVTEKKSGNVVGLWDLNVDVGQPEHTKSFAVKGNILLRYRFEWDRGLGNGNGNGVGNLRAASAIPASPLDILPTGSLPPRPSRLSWQDLAGYFLGPARPRRSPVSLEGSGCFTDLFITPGRLFRTIAPIPHVRRQNTYIRRRGAPDSIPWNMHGTIEEAISYLEKELSISNDFLHLQSNFEMLLETILLDPNVLRESQFERMSSGPLVRHFLRRKENAAMSSLPSFRIEPTAAVGFILWAVWVGRQLSQRKR